MKLGMFKLIGIFVERPQCGSSDWSPSRLSSYGVIVAYL